MINTIPASVARTPATRPASRPVAAQPEQIDLSTIDTPEKAALLPVLNPATMVSLRATFDNGEAIHKGANASLNLFVDNIGTFGIYYHADAKQPFELSGRGAIAHAGLQEKWAYNNDGALQVTGNVGSSAESLKITQKEDGIYDTHIDGKVGTQDVHLTIHRQDYGFSWDGTIGAARVHEEVKLDYKPDGSQTLCVKGTIGSTPIEMNGNISPSGVGESYSYGEGFVGSVPVSYSHQDHMQ